MAAIRSIPVKADIVSIYMMGPAVEYCDSCIGGYRDTAMCASQGEDFADTHWPVVVKAKADVTRSQLVQHLRDLAEAIEQGKVFVEVDEEGMKEYLEAQRKGETSISSGWATPLDD